MTEKQDSHHEVKHEDQSWFEKPSSIKIMIWGLVIVCALTLVAQLVFTMFDEHHPPHFDVETVFGFQAIFGFVAFVVIVYLGRFLRLIVKREEDYYDA